MKKDALRFIVFLGIVSLFADITYEGARSITGPYLSILGASGLIVGITAGLGEFIGYAVRLLSGFLTDKTKSTWPIAFVGYAINLLAVPLLALATNWQMAASLIVLERFGKAIRVPPRDVMLSYAAKHTGRGFGFGIHEALDQTGALTGPILIAALLFFKESYRTGFAYLLIPALLAIVMLIVSRVSYPTPHEFEKVSSKLAPKGLNRTYWIYVIAVSFIAAGYADFALISYHFQKASIISSSWIPLFYAIAMATAGLSALGIGKLFDLKGMGILIIATLIASLAAPFAFLGGFSGALIGMVLWGIGMGSQGSIMHAVVAEIVSKERRGSAFGILNLSFGIFWFAGSAIMGLLYDVHIHYLIAFSIIMQVLSVPFLLKVKIQQAA